MLVLSHRGNVGADPKSPENTLEAFQNAAESGVDGIETDVRLSSDRELVLFHDRNVDHVPVSMLTRAQLETAVGYEVPTLARVLSEWPRLFWNIEIKDREAFDPVAAVLKQYRATHRLLVTSFWHDRIAQLASTATLPCGVLMSHNSANHEPLLHFWRPYEWMRALVWYFAHFDLSKAADLRAEGFRSFVYGVQTVDDHRICKQAGLDGIITDHPERV